MVGNNVLYNIKKQLYNKENESNVNKNEVSHCIHDVFSELLLF